MTLKKNMDEHLTANVDRYINWGEALQTMPEEGYSETKTTAFVWDQLADMGLDSLEPLPITGCIGSINGRGPGKTIAVLAELDAVLCPEHPLADPATGMAHVCGHHAQLTMLLAVADALTKTQALKQLNGNVLLFALPAEELLPEAKVKALKNAGKIEFASGKKELLRLGYFQDVDATISIHAYTEGEPIPPLANLQTSCNGFATIRCVFRGKAAHSAEGPHQGVNALNAAVLAINALQAQRETFHEDECIRLAYTLTKGGVSLSTIPDLAELDVQVRAKRLEKLKELIARVSGILENAASMIGAKAEIISEMGYQPYAGDEKLLELIAENAEALQVPFRYGKHGYYCTDLGDVSMVIPSAHVACSGYRGHLHGKEFMVDNPERAYGLPARLVAATILDYLNDQI